jgi:HK97 family phage portal protein
MTLDGYVGIDPLRYMRDALGGVIATQDFASSYFGRGGTPEMVLESDKKLLPEDKARLRQDWEAIYTGPERSRVAVMDQGLKASPISVDNAKGQMIETRQYQLGDLARMWGVPPHLIFDLSRSTNNNIEQQSLEFVLYHMQPRFEMFAQAATRFFAEDEHYFEFLTDKIVAADLTTRMAAYRTQRELGLVTANDLLRRENMPPINGAAGTERWRPANMMVAGEPPERAEQE